MSRLVEGNGLDVCVESSIKASFGKVILREICKALFVECSLEVFKCESVVENVSCDCVSFEGRGPNRRMLYRQ